MKPATFRKIALSLPEATEGSHFSNADFRIAGKIFATLALEHQGYGVLLLTPDQQAGMVQDGGVSQKAVEVEPLFRTQDTTGLSISNLMTLGKSII